MWCNRSKAFWVIKKIYYFQSIVNIGAILVDYVVVVEDVNEIFYFKFCIIFGICVLEEDSFVANAFDDVFVVANCDDIAFEDVEFVVYVDANDWTIGRNTGEPINIFLCLFWCDGYASFFNATDERSLAKCARNRNLVASYNFVEVE